MSDPFKVVRDFEAAICEYTGAPYCVTTTSCTMALLLAVRWHLRGTVDAVRTPGGQWMKLERPWVEIPKRTYVSVPMSIIHAWGRPRFRNERWRGAYELKPLRVFDCARMFTSGMYRGKTKEGYDITRKPGDMLCVSFHTTKILGDTQGGAILHDNPEADAWLRRMRFDGRTEGVAPKDDHFREIGYHCYMSPDVAARLLHRLAVLPKHNEPLPNDDYPDLSQLSIFK